MRGNSCGFRFNNGCRPKMIVDPEWALSRSWISSSPVNASTKFVDRYRGIPPAVAFVVAAMLSFVLAVISGILGGLAAMYLYDRGNSKGDDFAIALGGLFAVGTLTFVVVFTWLQKIHHPISSRTPLFAFYSCLTLPAVATFLSLSEMDDHYLLLALGDWLAIVVLGLSPLFICRRWWHDSEQGF
jgi:hypothetical protein